MNVMFSIKSYSKHSMYILMPLLFFKILGNKTKQQSLSIMNSPFQLSRVMQWKKSNALKAILYSHYN